jgi:hypothetical protein
MNTVYVLAESSSEYAHGEIVCVFTDETVARTFARRHNMIVMPIVVDELVRYAELAEYSFTFSPDGRLNNRSWNYVDYLEDNPEPLIFWVVPTFAPNQPFWRVSNVIASGLTEAQAIADSALKAHIEASGAHQ